MCERSGVDVNEVRRAIGADARIWHHFLYPGVRYGRSCFPKDILTLSNSERTAGVICAILDAVHKRNARQRESMIERIRARLGGNLRGKHMAVSGLANKPKTDDVREAPAICIVGVLLELGPSVCAYDPQAMSNARRVLADRLVFGTDAYSNL